MKAAFANLNDSAMQVFIEEAGNPQFLKRRLGVAGGAVSQDQDYLNRHAAALKIKEPLEYPLVVDTVMASLLNLDANVSADTACSVMPKRSAARTKSLFQRGRTD